MKNLLIVANYDSGCQFSVLWENKVFYPKEKEWLDQESPYLEKASEIYKIWARLDDEKFKTYLKTKYAETFKKIFYVENGIIEQIK